jgi:hypothetical protein
MYTTIASTIHIAFWLFYNTVLRTSVKAFEVHGWLELRLNKILEVGESKFKMGLHIM